MKRKALSDTEVGRLRDVLGGTVQVDVVGERFLLLIRLILTTGIRTDEVCTLRVGSLDFDNLRVKVHRPAKHSNPRDAHLSRALAKDLKVAVQGMSETDFLVWIAQPNRPKSLAWRKAKMQQDWLRLRLRVFGGECDLGLHSLRHTAARKIYEASRFDIMKTKLYLGHKALASTQHYVSHITFDDLQMDVKKAFKGI